jgi:hypothetical protein
MIAVAVVTVVAMVMGIMIMMVMMPVVMGMIGHAIGKTNSVMMGVQITAIEHDKQQQPEQNA